MKTVVLSRLLFTFILFYFTPGKTDAQAISGTINTYHRVTAINTVTNTLSLSSAAGLSVDTKVLIIQMKGATINNANSVNFGDLSAINNAGNYEVNYICGIAGNDVLLSLPLARSYTVSGAVQLVSIPVYNSVTVTGTVTGLAWSNASGTGGVIALEAQTIFLNNNIDASGIGFRPGGLVNYTNGPYDCTPAITVVDYALPLMPAGSPQYVQGAPKGEGIAAHLPNQEYARGKQANGGGGGNNHNTGGGGGGNYGAGGQGGAKSLESFIQCHGPGAGLGGLSLAGQGYTPANNRVFMGGGGGAGHENNDVGQPGGIGGGIIFITANSIVGTGTGILANGARSINPAYLADPLSAGGDGGGGGGGGGAVILNINSVTGNIQASATGARGSDAARTGNASDCPGSGGGGGGGVVWMKGGAPIANVTAVVTGGANGTGSPLSPNAACRNTTAGATAGANGAALTGFVPVLSASAPICEPLPLNELKSFTGKSASTGNLLQWQMHSTDNIERFELERTIDRVRYTTIAHRANTGALSYSATDETPAATTCYYRLKVVRTNHKVDYSRMVRITTQTEAQFQWITMHPNPVIDKLTLNLYSKQNSIATITIYKGTGQQIYNQQARLAPGYSSIKFPLPHLPEGIYWMAVESEGIRLVKTLVKK